MIKYRSTFIWVRIFQHCINTQSRHGYLVHVVPCGPNVCCEENGCGRWVSFLSCYIHILFFPVKICNVRISMYISWRLHWLCRHRCFVSPGRFQLGICFYWMSPVILFFIVQRPGINKSLFSLVKRCIWIPKRVRIIPCDNDGVPSGRQSRW